MENRMQKDTSLERLLPSSDYSISPLLFSTNFLALSVLSLHLLQMILQNDTPWLGGDSIGENLIANQWPVNASSRVNLSSTFCLLRCKNLLHLLSLRAYFLPSNKDAQTGPPLCSMQCKIGQESCEAFKFYRGS